MNADTGPLAEAISRSAQRLRELLGGQAHGSRPPVALLLGSGWGGAADAVREARDIDYAELPAFPRIAVGGHRGVVRVGRLGERPVVVLMGRQHTYETGQADAMKGAVRSLAAAGVDVLVQTHAAGSLDLSLPPGDCMLVSDHLNLVQRSPLVGEAGDSRFVDLTDAYDPALRASARATAERLGLPLHEGVLAWQLGPQFGTPAEIRMLRLLGASAVGMSVVPETLLARHAGLRVLALSLFTNYGSGLSPERLSHAHTLAAAAAAGARAAALVSAIIEDLDP